MDAMFPLAPDSAIPQRWKNDPRTRGWTGFYIMYECTGDRVRARVCPLPHRSSWWVLGWQPGCFTANGTSWLENANWKPYEQRIGWFEFDGIAERYQFLPPDQFKGYPGVTLRLLPPATTQHSYNGSSGKVGPLHCDVCGKTATVHTVEAIDGVMVESHRCEEHAGPTMTLHAAAMENFVAFVRSQPRMPTMDELRSIGAAGLLQPLPGEQSPDDDGLELLRLIADQVMNEPR